MGNQNSRESRSSDQPGGGGSNLPSPGFPDPSSTNNAPPGRRDQSTRSRNRISRADLSFFGIGAPPGASGTPHGNHNNNNASSQADEPFTRRETRQEREARRLERERAARKVERERSIREENVDGGFLVTLGTYTGSEDFNKQAVRQLQIERRLAPFWKPLNDHSSSWSDYQLVSAVRGLPIPAADQEPPAGFMPSATSPPSSDPHNVQSLTVPLGPRTLSTSSDHSLTPNSGMASPTTPSSSSAAKRSASPFKPRAKALAAALSLGGPKNSSQTDMNPRETQLPHDPLHNGKPIEVVLYKDADECPICFLTYPPFLNRTRCCDQLICSECFVQIKRPDPHLPDHPPEATDEVSGMDPKEAADQLISEPSTCPYCTQSELGVTYEPPPFRRGLSYSHYDSLSQPPSSPTAATTPTTSTSPPSETPAQVLRRRTQSLSANAPNVVTTDRIRPDWATKLATARAHRARRAAAATALHHAAFLTAGHDQRSFSLRPGRFSRRLNSGAPSNILEQGPSNSQGDGSGDVSAGNNRPSSSRHAVVPGSVRSPVQELEDVMIMEAIRLSLVAEEERKRKDEKKAQKEAQKEAKRKEKEDQKALKQQQQQQKKQASGSHVYGSGSTSRAGSSVSLSLGRFLSGHGSSSSSSAPPVPHSPPPPVPAVGRQFSDSMKSTQPNISSESTSHSNQPALEDRDNDAEKGKEVVRDNGGGDTRPPVLPIPIAGTTEETLLRGGHSSSSPRSHLRQVSNASSRASTQHGSYSQSYLGQGIENGGDDDENERDREQDGDSGSSMPMFNFKSLAEMVGVNIDDDHHGVSVADDEKAGATSREEHVEQVESEAVSPAATTPKNPDVASEVSLVNPPAAAAVATGLEGSSPQSRDGNKTMGTSRTIDRGHGVVE